MVSVITCTIREHLIGNIIENYTNQLFKDKELIIILNKDEMDINLIRRQAGNIEGISVYQLPQDYTLGECLNYGMEKANFDYIAKFDDDDYYAPYYLTESLNALKKTNANIVGKEEFFVFLKGMNLLLMRGRGLSNRYVKHVAGATLVFEKSITDKIKFPKLVLGEDTEFQKNCIDCGYRIYSTSRYNFTNIREKNADEHTWKISNERLIKHGEIVAYTDDFKSRVTRQIDE